VTDPDLIGLFVEPLEAVGVSYMITGCVASVIYGDPRFTRDVDLVMELQLRDPRSGIGLRPGRVLRSTGRGSREGGLPPGRRPLQ
jgi:hypothetical protein